MERGQYLSNRNCRSSGILEQCIYDLYHADSRAVLRAILQKDEGRRENDLLSTECALYRAGNREKWHYCYFDRDAAFDSLSCHMDSFMRKLDSIMGDNRKKYNSAFATAIM